MKKKYSEEYHDQSNVVCGELKANMNENSQSVVAIGKVPQKEAAGKGGYYTWPICMVQFILDKLVNGTLETAI